MDRLVPQGMFLDGITYASISRNMAIGKGSFWAPLFRSDVFFAEHPPMMFGLEAIFFKFFGDHYWVEKLYCFFVWTCTILLIKQLWHKTNTIKNSYILVILLFTIVPTSLWAYTNNILDTTMALFDIAAVIIIYEGLLKRGFHKISRLIVGALFICCALLTKGPVGLFPIGIPFAFWVAYEDKTFRQFLKNSFYSIIILLTISIVFILLYQIPDAQVNFNRYLNEQLFSAMQGRREITGGTLGRFQMLYDLFMLLLIPVILGSALLVINKLLRIKTGNLLHYKQHFIFFLLIGLGGSLPILLSVKQRAFYLLPALPYYIIAICLLILPLFYHLTEKLSMSKSLLKRFKIIAGIVSVGLIVYLGSKVNQIGRDREMLEEINIMSTYLPEDRLIGVCNEIEQDYSFLSYIQRYNRVNVSGKFWGAPYVIVDSYKCGEDFTNNLSRSGYTLLETELVRYKLYLINYPLNIDFIQLNPVFRTTDK